MTLSAQVRQRAIRSCRRCRRLASTVLNIRLLTAVVLAVCLLCTGCVEADPVPTAQEVVDRTESALIAQGLSTEVAECVVRLGRYDLRVGPLDDVTADELTLTCERAQSVLDGGDGDDDSTPTAVDGPDTLGDDSSLDQLWRKCEGGSGSDCDELFRQAPVGSDYEQFGVSCGRRDDVLNCSELDEVAPVGQ